MMTGKTLLMPPLAFLVVLGAVMALARLSAMWALRGEKKGEGEGESYACGEDFTEHMIQPDYSQFFPFAFFFTILHVVAMVITTVPVGTAGSYTMAGIYVAGAVMGLIVLFRK